MVLAPPFCYHANAGLCSRILTMRGSLLWLFLCGLLGLPLALADDPTKDRKQVEADEQRLKDADLKNDGATLLSFLKSRTITEVDRQNVDALIAKLGASSFKVREQASQDLISKGPAVLEQLRHSLSDPDLEVQRRCEVCIQRIKENDHFPDLSAAVVRLIGTHKPAGAAEVLLSFLACADNESLADEIRETLPKVATIDGKLDNALVYAMHDKLPVRRAAAGRALVMAGAGVKYKTAIYGLLSDPDATVRWRVAMALVMRQDKVAVPTLIDLLPDLAQYQAWQIEDMLFRLAEGKSPPAVSLGKDESARQSCRQAWQAWWKEHAATASLAGLRNGHALLGRTTMIMLDVGRIIEVEGDAVRWQIDGLDFPLDLQVLDNDHILIAEYYGNKVTERDFKGQVVWQCLCPEPQMAQRLPNGNTFIASKYRLLEVDPAGREVMQKNLSPANDGIMKSAKLASGEIVCVFDTGRVARLDATASREIAPSFRIAIGKPLFGGRVDVLPNGGVLIPHHLENKVVEYDSTGKQVWQVHVDQPIAATRLRNGDTLVTSMSQNRAVEFDRAGNEVWQYQRDSRVTRAIRR
jgi:HEAT repeat protein